MSSRLNSNSWTSIRFLLPRLNSCQAKKRFSKEIISLKTLWKTFSLSPPPNGVNTSLVHRVSEFYRQIYFLSGRIDKRNKFGIWLKIENSCLETLRLIIKASFTNKQNKLPLLDSARTEIEVLKRLLTITQEIKIIQIKNYLQLESDLQEISKMTNGWIKYLAQKEP